MSMGKSFDLCLNARYSDMNEGPILTLVFDFFFLPKLLRKHNVYIFLESTLEQELSCKKSQIFSMFRLGVLVVLVMILIAFTHLTLTNAHNKTSVK